MTSLNTLSASKIKTLQTCTWKYWCSYVLKLPQESNSGASRGWISHLIFELLGEKKHYKKYKKIINSGTTYACPCTHRLIKYHAKKLDVYNEQDMELIDCFIMRGLLYDFFGKDHKKPSKAISEQDFNLQIEEDGKLYSMRGFIDKLFIYDKGSHALIRDFKTSKQKFKGKEITDNLQNLMYCLAVKKLFPKVKTVDVEFLFLKFSLDSDLLGGDGPGVMKMERISDLELEGFEYQLTAINDYLNNFTEEDAKSGYAATRSYPADGTFGGPLACGKEGFKKSRGEHVLDKEGNKIPNFICDCRLPFEYYELQDENGSIIECFKHRPETAIDTKHKLLKKKYTGCPHFFEKNDFLV
jgi:hypothetical protein